MSVLAVLFCVFLAVYSVPSGVESKKEETVVSQESSVVSVQYLGEHVCGGVIYMSDYVITAAQCIDGKDMKGITVRQNSVNHNKGGEVRYVSAVYKHPQYDVELKYNDLAVLKVRELQPPTDGIVLIAKNVTTETATLQVYGWGMISGNGGVLSPVLKKSEVAFRNRATCRTEMGSLSVTERMICTSAGSNGQNACEGDQGGPLLKNKELYGVFSWNRKCDVGSSVYTYIFEYLHWIKTVTD